MIIADLYILKEILRNIWDEETAHLETLQKHPYPYHIESVGQCYVIALLVKKIFGGEIIKASFKTDWGGKITHYWNKIDSREYDLASDQFWAISFIRYGEGYNKRDVWPLSDKSGKVTKNYNFNNKRFKLLWDRFQKYYSKCSLEIMAIENGK